MSQSGRTDVGVARIRTQVKTQKRKTGADGVEREYFQNELTKSSRHIHTESAFVRSSGLSCLQEVGELAVLAPHTSSHFNLLSYCSSL